MLKLKVQSITTYLLIVNIFLMSFAPLSANLTLAQSRKSADHQKKSIKKTAARTLSSTFTTARNPSLSFLSNDLLEVNLTKTIYSAAEEVKVTLNAVVPVGINNDLTKSSTQNDGIGKRTVSLGKIPAQGLYSLRFVAGTAQVYLNLIAIKSGNGFEIIDLKTTPGIVSQENINKSSQAWQKIHLALTVNLVTTAFREAVRKIFLDNLPSTQAQILIVMTFALGAAGGLIPVVTAAALRGALAKELAIDFVLAFLDELVKATGQSGAKLISRDQELAARAVIAGTEQWLNWKDFSDSDKYTKIITVMQTITGVGKVVAVPGSNNQVTVDSIDNSLKTMRFMIKLK